jgi:hypothetical protein
LSYFNIFGFVLKHLTVLWVVYDFWHNTTKNDDVLKINQDVVDCKLACVAGGIRGHERMGSLKYRLPKNDTF